MAARVPFLWRSPSTAPVLLRVGAEPDLPGVANRIDVAEALYGAALDPKSATKPGAG